MNEFERSNRANWNRLAPIHAQSGYYDVQAFKAGKSTLLPLEREEVGEVAGERLLHLQCHFGLDTLSWARLGALVTGVDYSEEAVALARSLSAETGLPARFVLSPVADLPQVLSGEFDVVYTSYGVLCWLPDLRRWAQVIAHFLRPGGRFYMVEGHPFANVFYNEPDATELRVAYPYFHRPAPEAYPCDGSYASDEAILHWTSYEWSHSLSDVVTALLSAGLRLEFLREFPFGGYRHLPFMVQGADGWWRLPEHQESVPLMFSLQARKPEAGAAAHSGGGR
jgi:SAM-dependent methyltransferase